MHLRCTGILAVTFLAAAVTGCSGVPLPFGDDDEDISAYPERVQVALQEAERLVSHSHLREAIGLVESTLVDYPRSSPLRVRLAELRSMRQVCFREDWSEADGLCGRKAWAQALMVLRRIEGYGDPEMVARAQKRMGPIQAGRRE